MRRSAATSALGRSAAVRERRSLRGAAQRSSGDDHIGLSFQSQHAQPREPASNSFLNTKRVYRQGLFDSGTFSLRWFSCSSPSLTMTGRARGARARLYARFSQIVTRRQGATSFFWVSPKWSHSFPGRHRSPLGLAPFVIDTPSVDVMGHARQASSTYARFDRLDIASGGRQRPSHFHPIVDNHPHTHTPIFSTQSSPVVM